MSAQDHIDRLDVSLARCGEDVILLRTVGSAPNQQEVDVGCRAYVTAVTPEEIMAGISAMEQKVILSPTPLAAWPGGMPAQPQEPGTPKYLDPRIPKINTDKMWVRGTKYSVTAVSPVFIQNVLVRINLRVG